MNAFSWKPVENPSLAGKTVVITGATGGLGRAMCRYLLLWGAEILMINRSEEKSRQLQQALLEEFPDSKISFLLCDLQYAAQVHRVCLELARKPIDILMLNAGTYALPRLPLSEGYDTVFKTNFISHYQMVKQLLPVLKANHTKVIITGSIAHRFHPSDPEDVDFSRRQGANNVYGNSKRYLMFALTELLSREGVSFAIGHPGISFTGITSHYPEKILPMVRFSMLLLFMHPEKACRSMLSAIFEDLPPLTWMGPGIFDIWGNPRKSALTACEEAERQAIFQRAEAIDSQLKP